jgi:ectoine hydroxylase
VTTVAEPLSGAQVEAYARDGYLLFPGVFAPDEIDALRAEARRLLSMALNSSLALGKTHPRLDMTVSPGSLRVRNLQPVNDLSPVIAAISEDPRLIAPKWLTP